MATLADWLSLPGLTLLATTNSAPVIIAWLCGRNAAWPIDGGLVLRDGERLFGANKTWRGLVAAALAGALLGALWTPGLARGAVAGVAAIAGDLLSSFVKRRLRTTPGTWVPILDQIPEAVLPLLVGWQTLGLDLQSCAGTVGVFTILDLVASRVLGSSRQRPPPSGPGQSAHSRPGRLVGR